MDDRSRLITEYRNARSMHLHRLTVGKAFDLINHEDSGVAAAVAGPSVPVPLKEPGRVAVAGKEDGNPAVVSKSPSAGWNMVSDLRGVPNKTRILLLPR